VTARPGRASGRLAGAGTAGRASARITIAFVALLVAACHTVPSAEPPELARVAVLSDFGARAAPGSKRRRLHAGIDYQGRRGDPVLAAADGVVLRRLTTDTCGLGLIVEHPPWNRFTVYCHFLERTATPGSPVSRGDVIGSIGDTGNARGHPHVHLELWSKLPRRKKIPGTPMLPDGVIDPHSALAGCFEAGRAYPTDRFVLTYPVRCKPSR
jgi:murein DD-endopeptidase MepM/ murein hydrolase activator NlpD